MVLAGNFRPASNGVFHMKRFVVMAALVAFLPVSAIAADMPVKAPPSFGIYPSYAGQGFYFGVATSAGVAQADIKGSSLLGTSLVNGNLTAAGASVGGTVGWMKGNGTTWYAIEATLAYNNITASAPVDGVRVEAFSRWDAEQVIKFGGFQQILAALPNLGIAFPSLPNLPSPPGFNIAANTSHPYIMAGVREFGMGSAVGLANAKTVGIAPLIGAGVINQLLDKDGKLSGIVLDTGAEVIFADKGKSLTFNPGGPPVFGGNLNMGKQYFAYAKVLW